MAASGLPSRGGEAVEAEAISFERLFDASLDLICVADFSGMFRRVNASFSRVLGWTQEALLARPFVELVHPDDRARTEGAMRSLAQGGAVSQLENRYQTVHNGWRWLSWTAYPVPGEELIFASARDVTHQRRSAQLDADYRAVLEMIAVGMPQRKVLERLARAVEAQVPGMLASMLLLDSTGTRVTTGAAPSLPAAFNEAIEGEPIGPDAGSCGTAAYTHSLVVAEDIATDPRWVRYRDGALAFGLRACWSLPIYSSREEVLGTFAMYYLEPRAPTLNDLALLEGASRLASVAIERERANGTVDLLRRALDRTADIVLIAEAEALGRFAPRITYVNQPFERITGWPASALVGAPISRGPGSNGAGGDVASGLDTLRAALARAQPAREVVTIRTHDERPLPLEVDVAPVTDEAGGLTHWVAVARDVTERHEAWAEMRERERRFRALASATNDAMWDWDLASDALWWSEGFYALFGYRPDEESSTIASWVDHIHPDDRDAVVNSIRASIHGGGSAWSCEYRYLRKDGSPAWVLHRGLVLRNDDGAPVRMVGGMTDLTERRAHENRIREQAELLDQTSDAIVVEDLDGVIRLWNRAAARIYGLPATAAIGRRSVEILYQDVAAYQAAIEGVRERGAHTGEMTCRGAEGRELAIDARWSMVRDEAGHPRAVLGVHTDITDKKKLEAQYLRAQRLESIGNLAGGIAHDLNNVLTPILMSVPLLRSLGGDPRIDEMLDTVEQAAQRGADMVRQVLSFARGAEGRRAPVNPLALLHDVGRIARDSFLRAIEVVVDAPARLPSVIGDATQLHQVLLNLAVNARDAMPTGGTLRLSADAVVLDDTYAAMRPEAKPGRHVVVRVSDTGTGIPKELQDRIFEPFFTTKPHGQGTGLGLSTVMALIKSHGGFLTLDSQVGRGTTFEVFLPAAAVERAAPAPARHEPPRGHGELVLVVDDEAPVLNVTRRILESRGYRVVTAADGAEAIAIFAARKDEIAVVVTDVMMPHIDGVATARALRRIDPDIRIIATSGVATPDTENRLAAAGVTQLVPKPFTAATLLDKLRDVLSDA